MPASVGYLLLVVLLICVAAIMVRRGVRERQRRKNRAAMQERRCLCGYVLAGLELPRCPECGRMIGFDKTAAELGISEEEMRKHAEGKRAEKRG